MMSTTSTPNLHIRLSENWKGVVLCAVFLPACLAAINHFSLRSMAIFQTMEAAVAVAVSLLVQLAVAAWVLSAMKLPNWLRTTIYVWCLGLINLQLIVMALDTYISNSWRHNTQMPAAALIGGEIGVLWVWAIMGRGSTLVRLPLCLIPVWALWWLWKYSSGYQSTWSDAMTLEASALIVLCIALRLFGFRLLNAEGQQRKEKQFGMRHMLIATSLLAVIFTLVRITEQVGPFFGTAFFGIRSWMALLALTTAFCMITAMWAALGKERTLKRLAFFCLLVGLAGGLHWYDAERFLKLPSPWNIDSEKYRLAELRAWWMGWFLISSSVLLAILFYFRLGGYRLTRSSGSDN